MLFDVRSALRSTTGIAAVLAAVLLVSACGRRGPLEAPPDASATAKPAAAVKPAAKPAPRKVSAPPAPATFGLQDQTQPQGATLDTPDDETEEPDQSAADSVALTPTPTAPGTRKKNRSFYVPKEPFILDPLL